MRPSSKLLAVALTGIGLVGLSVCGSDDPAQPPSGDMAFTLTFEAPAAVGQNKLMIDLADAKGQPVSGATLTVDPQMPHHGHGSTETAVVTDKGGGRYEAFPVTLQMPGMWEITISATHGGETSSKTMKLTVP